MNEQKQYKEDTGIDLLKFISATLIIMSHTGFLKSYNEVLDFYFVNVLFRWCVPFFFICAGFYLNEKLLKYEIRLLVLYSIWTLFYTIINRMNFSIESFVNHIRFGIIGPFWYFPSLIIGILFIYMLTRFLPDKISCLIVLLMYIIGLFGDAYANVMPMGSWYTVIFGHIHALLFSYTSRNGLFFCSLFIWIGKMLKKYRCIVRTALKKISSFWILLPIVICFSLLALELHFYINYKTGFDANVLISIVPLAVLLFILGLKYNPFNARFGVIMRNCSTIMYTIHPYYMGKFRSITESSIINYLLVFGMSLITALVIVFISKYIKLLKYSF